MPFWQPGDSGSLDYTHDFWHGCPLLTKNAIRNFFWHISWAWLADYPSSGPFQGSAVSGVGTNSGGFVLASTPVVPGPSGASGGNSGVPSKAEGSTQTTAFSSLLPEPSSAQADCVLFIQRSARHFGISSAVACQLAYCQRSSTHLNYQAKWTVYCEWCRHHDHSVSHPSIPKVADFLLYLRRSLSLSYSSIASYCSMLSEVFRFVLPDLSSHFFLRDLRSFHLERPSLSSRVPPWDLLRVLESLRGPWFEPLSSAFLWDLTRKVFILRLFGHRSPRWGVASGVGFSVLLRG